jgi:hypothetical protein
LNTAVPFSAVVLGAEGCGCAHTVQVLMQAFVNTSSTLHTAHSSSSSSSAAAAAAAAVPDVSSIKGKASVLVLHYGGHGGGTGVSHYSAHLFLLTCVVYCKHVHLRYYSLSALLYHQREYCSS